MKFRYGIYQVDNKKGGDRERMNVVFNVVKGAYYE